MSQITYNLNMKELRKMKKFRFQLLHRWITENYTPCNVADIGGGKGVLCFLLNQSGFQCTVIDPLYQTLPKKLKDLDGNKQKIAEEGSIKRIGKEFNTPMAKHYDLLIGLHTHGSNMKIIEASAEYKKAFILLPYCVINEPIEKSPNIDWFESLQEYAIKLGHKIKRFELNFRGQNTGFYTTNLYSPKKTS